jgi:hypothetical protein
VDSICVGTYVGDGDVDGVGVGVGVGVGFVVGVGVGFAVVGGGGATNVGAAAGAVVGVGEVDGVVPVHHTPSHSLSGALLGQQLMVTVLEALAGSGLRTCKVTFWDAVPWPWPSTATVTNSECVPEMTDWLCGWGASDWGWNTHW